MKLYFLAALAGGLTVASYAPLEWWWLMPLCIATLYYVLQGTSLKDSYSKTSRLKNSFGTAFIFGLAQFGLGASWVYVSLQTYGNMPVWMATIAVFFFVAALAFFTGLVGLVFALLRFKKAIYWNALIFTALWVISEWLRSVVLTGFPWLDVGYSQTARWLSAYAPIGSVYLVSFVCVLCSVLALLVIQHISASKVRSVESYLTKKISAAVLAIATMVFGGALLQTVEWSEASGKTYQIAVVQANVAIENKWDRKFQTKIIDDYLQLIQQYEADLVILPETALPLYLDQTNANFWQQLRGKNKALLSGVIERDLNTKQIYNSVNLVCGSSQKNNTLIPGQFYQGEQVYRKQHLVPFGEYLPLRSLLNWVLDYLQIPMSDFSAGSVDQVLECDGMQIGLSICYEDAFTSGVRRSLPQKNQNGVLINISEDAWFGDSLAPHQRVQMAQMRALELARPMLRSANSGPSTYINHVGEVQATTKQFVADSFLVEVQPRTGDTPFALFGLWIIGLCAALVLLVSTYQFRYRKLDY